VPQLQNGAKVLQSSLGIDIAIMAPAPSYRMRFNTRAPSGADQVLPGQ
jgi:hypothetical protein